jgi:hypothetical protein
MTRAAPVDTDHREHQNRLRRAESIVNAPPTRKRRPAASDETPPEITAGPHRDDRDDDTACLPTSSSGEPLDADDQRVRILAESITDPVKFSAEICRALGGPAPSADTESYRTIGAVRRVQDRWRDRQADLDDASRSALALFAVPATRAPDSGPGQSGPHRGPQGQERGCGR